MLRKRLLRAGLLLGIAGMLTACASMSEQECLTANWVDQGYRDGSRGYPASRIYDHQEACAKVGVRPNQPLYTQGRNQGIEEYCQPENGWREGRLGNTYRNACPAHLESAFLRQYHEGARVYEAERYVAELHNRLRRLESALIHEKDDRVRRSLRRELRHLDMELMRARGHMQFMDRGFHPRGFPY